MRWGLLVVLSFICGGNAQAQSELIEQWGLAIIGQSSGPGTTAGSVGSMLGPPQAKCEFNAFDFIDSSWRTRNPDDGEEWVEVRFSTSVFATAVEVHETLNPGAITGIFLRDPEGQWHSVWEGSDPSRSCPAVLRVDFSSRTFASSEVRIELNTALLPGWNQLDAVKLIGLRATNVQPLFENIAPERIYKMHEGLETPPNLSSYALGDYDNDGWPDLLAHRPIYPTLFLLLHNETDGSYSNRSTDLALEPLEGVNGGGKFADYDNDGDLDIFIPHGSIIVSRYGRDVLLRNDMGLFTDVSNESGITDSVASSSALFFDYDRDGWLDLYVGHFTYNETLQMDSEVATNSLYRNLGDGTFADVTRQAGLDIALHPPGSLFRTLRGTSGTNLTSDFNDDGWPDLFISVEDGPNFLLLNDQRGGFINATTKETGRLGFNVGAASGDFDNDGDFDIFAAAIGGDNTGVSTSLPERSVMLFNLGGGEFIDVTEGIGLKTLTAATIVFPRFIDFDNDGDLDLMTSEPSFSLFINNGDMTFSDATFQAGLPGVETVGDFDNDGFLDIWYAQYLFRNRGNDNHYLRIDLVGTASNRDGIGARIVAISGDLHQTRELKGGDGWFQDEYVVHLGLGPYTQVDQLEIHWPSGQIDHIDNVPADQEIRIIEGRGQWYPAPRTTWDQPPPQRLTAGQATHLRARARPVLFEPSAQFTRVRADLSNFGGPESVPLIAQDDGSYLLDHELTIRKEADVPAVKIMIEQQTSVGPYWTRLSHNVEVLPNTDTAVLEDYSTSLPQSFTLHQNHPTPFNSGTVIRFALPQNEEVELSVFNLAGQKVATLVEGTRLAGEYAINWDGKDDANHMLATGIYLYRLQTGAQQETQKLLLLR